MEKSSLTPKEIIGWDIHNWWPVIEFWSDNLVFKDKKVLALGEREGGISLYFASMGAKVICSDYGGIKADIQNNGS
jgi:hypothetical protein